MKKNSRTLKVAGPTRKNEAGNAYRFFDGKLLGKRPAFWEYNGRVAALK
jgi:hypothetical protein